MPPHQDLGKWTVSFGKGIDELMMFEQSAPRAAWYAAMLPPSQANKIVVFVTKNLVEHFIVAALNNKKVKVIVCRSLAIDIILAFLERRLMLP